MNPSRAELILETAARQRGAIAEIVECVRCENAAGMIIALKAAPMLLSAVRVVLQSQPSLKLRRDFAQSWPHAPFLLTLHKDTLLQLLRHLAPPPTHHAPLTLYRGEDSRARARRDYGLSWTRSSRTARSYIEVGGVLGVTGGSKRVLLRATAPPDAILFECYGADMEVVVVPALLQDVQEET